MSLTDKYKQSQIYKMVTEQGMSVKEATELMNRLDNTATDIYKQMKKDNVSFSQAREIINESYKDFVKKRDIETSIDTNEFDKNAVDRIIVESNAKMQEIIKWTHDNDEWLNDEAMKEITPAFAKGVIEFQQELIELGFEVRKNKVDFYVWIQGHYMCKFEHRDNDRRYDLIKPIFAPGLSKEQRANLTETFKFDNTVMKLCMKYMALMIYATLHKETVVIDVSKHRRYSSSTPRKVSENNMLPLTPKRYIIKHIEKGVPGHHAAPDHQVEVRPTVRHLKNGKIVPVKGFVKYKDKPKKESGPKTYKA